MALILSQNDSQIFQKLDGLKLEHPVFVSPTDTVYGLGTPIGDKVGEQRIRELKGRMGGHFIYLVKDFQQAKELAEIKNGTKEILQKYWPGPISFILRRADTGETIALRMPKNPFLLKLLDYYKKPILSTSCNLTSLPPVKNIEEAAALFNSRVDFYVDGGPVETKAPSTLVDLSLPEPRVLRAGSVPFSC